MKGYDVANGYMGYYNGAYRLFASEQDYEELMEELWDDDEEEAA